MSFLERTNMILDTLEMDKIKNSKIIIFGVGGVGGACVEALARCGVSNLTLVDGDTVSLSNKNRQIIALDSTIGKNKVDVCKERILDINSNAKVNAIKIFYNEETYNLINLSEYDYVVDCIDTVTSKLHIIEYCNKNNVRVISSTGTGNRMDPTKFEITDISKTKNDPLARVLRKKCKDLGVKKLKVLASSEVPFKIPDDKKIVDKESKRNIPGSISFVPPVAGMIIASEVIKDLIK